MIAAWSTRGFLGALFVVGLFSLTSACGGLIDPLDPMVGEPRAVRCANQDSDARTDVSFAEDIQPIIRGERGPGCSCHLPDSSDTPIGFEQSGLNLETYADLLAGGNRSKFDIVIPGQPCDSVFWQKTSPGPPFGSQMPQNGPPFLSPENRQLIADWIAEGARDN